MAISKTQWVSDVRDALLAMGKDVLPDTIEGGLNYCLQQLADMAAADEKIRVRLQQSFSITLTSGVATLPTTLITSPDAIGAFTVTLANTTNPLQYLPQGLDRYAAPPFSDWLYYTIHNGQITVFDYTGAVTSETAVTLLGNFVPTISTVPDVLSDDLVAIGIKWAMGQIEEEAA